MAHAEMMDRGADDDKGREEPTGCWEGLVTRVSAIWRTTDMLSGYKALGKQRLGKVEVECY